MYAVETTACQENPASASPTAAGPSRASDSANSGTGTTTADQTVSERPPATPGRAGEDVADAPATARRPGRAAARASTWPAAAQRHDHQPDRPEQDAGDLRGGRQLPQRPGGDHHGEDHLGLEHEGGQPGRHPGVHGGVEEPELAQRHEHPDQRPPAASRPAGAAPGRPPGAPRAVNRIAANSSGGTPCIPQSITTKLKSPDDGDDGGEQRSRGGTCAPVSAARSMKHQRMIMH